MLKWVEIYHHKIANNLEVNEVEQDGKCYILCYNPKQEGKERKERASFVAQIKTELARRGPSGLAKKKGYGRYMASRAEFPGEGVQGDRLPHNLNSRGAYADSLTPNWQLVKIALSD